MIPLHQAIRSLTIDNETRSLEVELPDGRVQRWDDAFPVEGTTLGLPRDFRRVTFDTSTRTVILIPPEGAPIIVEAYLNDDQMQRRADRPVVYLDQNQWIQLGRARHAPHKLATSERAAAEELIRYAQDQRVILPMSSGHFIETTQTSNAWRQQLGPLMVELSRGWLMRDPVRVRRSELLWMFSHHSGGPVIPVGDVITLDLSELSAEDAASSPRDPELLAEFQQVSDVLSAVTSIFAVLLEDVRLYSELGAKRAAQWATTHDDFAQDLKATGISKENYRAATLPMFLSDLSLDIAHSALASGVKSPTLEAWVSELAEEELASLPYVGRSRDVIHLRLCNPGDRWKANDLIDMLFLPCAAAYADFVVGEKKTLDYLGRAQRSRSGGAVLASSLPELLDCLGPALSAARLAVPDRFRRCR